MRSNRTTLPLTLGAVVAALVTVAPAPARAAAPTCHGVRATIVGTSSADVIHGTARRDVIVGLGGSDTIHAAGGDDLVCGGAGADHLYGGAGDDRLQGGQDRFHVAQEDGTERLGDLLSGGPGDDLLDVGVDRRSADNVVPDVVSWDSAAHGVHIDLRTRTARGEGHDRFVGGTLTVVGSSHADVVVGSKGPDRIEAGAGPDVVRAGGGGDTIMVDDYYQRGAEGDADQVWGGPGNDRIGASRGRDRLVGGPGDDSLEGGGTSNDVILGGRGDDQIDGEIWDSRRPQRFDGGPGVDGIQVDTVGINRHATASTGTWDMASGAMTFTLDGTVSLTVSDIEGAALATSGTSWSITGTSGDDSIGADANGTAPVRFDGLAGDDTFRGTDGDDVFDGGAGHDHSVAMFGGDDTCLSVEVIDGSDCEHVTP